MSSSNVESFIAGYSSSVGELVVEAEGDAITLLSIGGSPRQRNVEVDAEGANTTFLALFKLFDRYFAGKRLDFSGVKVALEGTSFQRRVWQALREISYGEVVSYGELADKVGSSQGARAVGSACARNPIPIIIPCHRVVAADGTIGGYSAGTGVEVKRRLLALEGASI